MGIDKNEIGLLAKSKAGHDKGHIYVVCQADEAYVYLADGKMRTLSNPKKKKRKHIQLIGKEHDISGIDDVGIKRLLTLFDKETGRN